MKKIFASFCLLAFAFLTFSVTPAYSREIVRESVSYNAAPGISYSTTKVTTSPTKMSAGAKVGTAIVATALIGGIITLGVLAANDRPHHEYHYDNYRGHSDFHNHPKFHHNSHHNSHHNFHNNKMPHH